MPVPELNIRDFGMDTLSLAGTLPAKLSAIRDAGFSQVMLSARDLMGFDAGLDAAVRVVKGSGLRVTGFQVLRDFEGLSGHLHDDKIDVAKAMLDMCAAVGGTLLLVCSSTSTHASDDPDALARDLRKLAMLALPLGIKVAYEGLSWGRTINEFTTAWDVVWRADAPNLGIGIDSFHAFATETSLADLDSLDPDKIFLVQLADFMWQEVAAVGSAAERDSAAQHPLSALPAIIGRTSQSEAGVRGFTRPPAFSSANMPHRVHKLETPCPRNVAC